MKWVSTFFYHYSVGLCEIIYLYLLWKTVTQSSPTEIFGRHSCCLRNSYPLKFCSFGLRLFSVFANAYFFPPIYLPTNSFLVWVYWNQEFLRLKTITGWNHLFVLTRFTGLLEYLKYRIRVRRSLRRRISHTYYFWNYHRFWPIRSGVLILSSSSQITPKSEKITQTSKESLDDAWNVYSVHQGINSRYGRRPVLGMIDLLTWPWKIQPSTGRRPSF